MKLILLSALLLIITGRGPKHEIHLSKCQIAYEATEQQLQIRVHLFLDDLEAALIAGGNRPLRLGRADEAPEALQILVKYIREHLNVDLNGKRVTYRFTGREFTTDGLATWCHFAVDQVAAVNSLGVDYDILMELFDDQQNVISIIGPKKRRGMFLFSKGSSSDIVRFTP